MTGNSLADLAILVIALIVYALVRWLQTIFPDPPPRRPRRRRKPPPDPPEEDPPEDEDDA